LVAEEVESVEDLVELVQAEADLQELGINVEHGAKLWPAIQAMRAEGTAAEDDDDEEEEDDDEADWLTETAGEGGGDDDDDDVMNALAAELEQSGQQEETPPPPPAAVEAKAYEDDDDDDDDPFADLVSAHHECYSRHSSSCKPVCSCLAGPSSIDWFSS
jgi:hypothetical protein